MLSYAQSFVGLFTPLVGLGLEWILIRELIYNKDQESSLLGTALFLKISGFFFTFICILVFLVLSNKGDDVNILIIIVSLSLLFRTFEIIDGFFKSKVMVGYIVIAHLAALGICSVLRIYLILSKQPVSLFAITIMLDFAIASMFHIYFYSKHSGSILRWRFDFNWAKKLLKNSWPYLFTGFVMTLYSKIDQVMLKNMLNSTAVGHYAAAVKISEACCNMCPIIAASLFPAIANAKMESAKKYIFRIERLYDLMFIMIILITLPVIFFSDTIINFLYGESFSISGKILQIHIMYGLIIAAGAIRANWILSENLQRYEFIIHLVGAISNILFNFVLIRHYGVIGAAWGTVLSYIFYFYNNRNRNKENKTIIYYGNQKFI